MTKRPNILLILIDAVRAKNLGCYGYKKPISPIIDNLSKEGVLFENAFSCSINTDPSVTSIFSGMYPTHHGIVMHGSEVTEEEIKGFQNSNIMQLQSILKNNNYTTAALDWLGRWHKKDFDYYHGIESVNKTKIRKKILKAIKKVPKLDVIGRYVLNHLLPKKISKQVRAGNDGQKITSKACELINQYKNKDFFMFIHYWDTHNPYNAPKNIKEKFWEDKYKGVKHQDLIKDIYSKSLDEFYKTVSDEREDVSDMLAGYDGSINYVDTMIKRIINTLKENDILDDTLIIVTSDHGESLIEHQILFDHHGLYEPTIHVPLILRYPKLFPKNKRINALIQHTDLLPSILKLLNINFEESLLDGKSFLPIINNETEEIRNYIFTEEHLLQRRSAIRDHKYKLITSENESVATCKRCKVIHGALNELYDLDSDPLESINIYSENQEITEKLSTELDKIQNEIQNKKLTMQNKTNDRENIDNNKTKAYQSSEEEEKKIKERLRSLGYID